MGTAMASSHLTLHDLERLMSRAIRFWRLITRREAELGHVLLLSTNRKSYIVSPVEQSHLTLGDFERSKSGHSEFKGLDLIMEPS